MIPRDWQRLAWNLALGSPLAYLVALIALCLMLAIPPLLRGADASLVMVVLIVGVPAIPLSYVFGLVPFLLISIATSILARALRGEMQPHGEERIRQDAREAAQGSRHRTTQTEKNGRDGRCRDRRAKLQENHLEHGIRRRAALMRLSLKNFANTRG